MAVCNQFLLAERDEGILFGVKCEPNNVVQSYCWTCKKKMEKWVLDVFGKWISYYYNYTEKETFFTFV